jgi:hypothetical protein
VSLIECEYIFSLEHARAISDLIQRMKRGTEKSNLSENAETTFYQVTGQAEPSQYGGT